MAKNNNTPQKKAQEGPVRHENPYYRQKNDRGGFEFVGVSYVLVGIVLGVLLYGRYDAAFPEFIQLALSGLFGWCALLTPVILIGEGIYVMREKNMGRLYFKMFMVFLALFCLCVLSSLLANPDGKVNAFEAFGMTSRYIGGGFLGALLGTPLANAMTVIPAVMIVFIVFVLLLGVIFKFSPIKLIIGFTRKVKEEVEEIDDERSYEMGQRARERMDDGIGKISQRGKNREVDFEVSDNSTAQIERKKAEEKARQEQAAQKQSKRNRQDGIEPDLLIYDMPLRKKGPNGSQESSVQIEMGYADDIDRDDDMLDDDLNFDNVTIITGETEPEQKPKRVRKMTDSQQAAYSAKLDESAKAVVIPYKFPSGTLLSPAKNKKPGGDPRGELRDTARKLVETLKSFGVDVTLLQVSRGPTVTRYELQPNVGVKVNKITSLADDIALNLAAASVRIEAPIPGKAAIGIEIPNKEKSSVALKDVLDSDEFKASESKVSVALGMDIAGKSVVANIAKMPHVLIAGATGSGKSVCINSLIVSILYKASPNEVKFVMIDPKRVELLPYNGIPHLLTPVVTDPKKASGALNWAVTEMVRRYDMFAESGVRDLEGYNAFAALQGEDKLPQIVIIIDELADLMMVSPKEVEDSICRLAQLARACGMHLVIATQRPSVNVITGIIKANIPSRIAFSVTSQIDSRTILDGAGAEKLLGSGDMLYMPMGASKALRLQGSFISDAEVERVVSFIKDTSETSYDEEIGIKINSGGEVADVSGDADELLPRAIELALAAGQISTSMLQRRLGIGYARAGRIVDQMEARGIISGADGSKPRNVLVSAEDLGYEE